MPSQYEIGVAVKLKKLAASKILRKRSERLGMKLFPTENIDQQLVVYERPEPIRGMQQPRGLGGVARSVRPLGFSTQKVSALMFGEQIRYDEKKLQETRFEGDWYKQATTDEIISRGSTQLAERYCNRVEFNVFQVQMTGGFTGDDGMGNSLFRVLFDVPQFTPAVLFSDFATSTPLYYLRWLMMRLRFGLSVDFRKGTMLMNSNTLNMILNNNNPADLGRVRAKFGQTLNDVDELNKVFLDNALPEVTVYDEDYLEDSTAVAVGAPKRFIPNGKIILHGKRLDGNPIGSYIQTPTVQGGGKKGEYLFVEDKRQTDNPYISVHHGHQAVPVPEYPEAIACITVASESEVVL